MTEAVTRRRLLAGGLVGACALAGCLQQPPRRTSRAVLITNGTDVAFTVTLRVYAFPEGATATDRTLTATAVGSPTTTSTGGATATAAGPEPPTDELEQVLRRREDLPPDEGFGVGGDELPAGDLRVRVTTTDGQSDSYDWTRLDRRSTLDVRVEPNAVRFTEVD